MEGVNFSSFGPSHNREGSVGKYIPGESGYMDSWRSTSSSKKTSEPIWRSKQPLVPYAPEDVEHVKKIKLQNKHILFGRPPTPGMKLSVGDRLRLFHHDHPKLSVAAAVTGILALSTAIGVGVGYAIDSLAHLTDRKNDKVGLVVGIVVGLISALTMTVHNFGLVRRAQLRFNAGAFALDTTTPQGQAYHLNMRRSPVIAAAMQRNAESLKGFQHENLRLLDTHVRDALELCMKHGFGRNVWSNSISEYEKLPIGEERPYWRATANGPDIREGYYYVSRQLTATQLLEEEVAGVFDRNEQLRQRLVNAFNPKEVKDLKAKLETGKGRRLEKEELAEAVLKNGLSSADAKLFSIDDQKKLCPEDVNSDQFKEMLRVIGDELEGCNGYKNFITRVKDNIGKAAVADSYLTKIALHMTGHKNDITRSFTRVDELTKVKPIYDGFRSLALYTLWVNLRDALSAVFGASTDSVNQGTTVGNQLVMFIPLTICASVVSVLLLGMTATPQPSKNAGGGNNNNGNQQANNSLNLAGYPAYQHAHAMLGTGASQQSVAVTG